MKLARLTPPQPLSREQWPPDYVAVWAWRQKQVFELRSSPDLIASALAYYSRRPVEFICHWCDTYDPRNAGSGVPAYMPFVLFQRQADLINFVMACIDGQQSGLVEKSRDMGATWICAALSVWLWRFRRGASIGWGSRKEQLVDRIGDADSIFEKIRQIIQRLPPFFLPPGFSMNAHSHYMRILNPDNGASITGEAGTNIGRGGRKLVYFVDEAAHLEKPDAVEAAIGDNTRVRIDISSVNGIGNVFHRRREAGREWDGGEVVSGATNVFIMDWRDHPAKDEAWYADRLARAEAMGLKHIFAQEVDRDYAAAVEGVIIPMEWINAAVDAHTALGFEATGMKMGALDVADGGGDLNAIAIAHGPILLASDDWGDGDTGQTTRRAVALCKEHDAKAVQYDSIGVGAGVKAEGNRLAAEGLLPDGFRFHPWNAGAGVLWPERRLEPNDRDAPKNKDFFANLKAQAWWELRRRFERTYRARVEGLSFSPDEMISLPSNLPRLDSLKKELAQATMDRSASMKVLVNKTPDGTKSPNRADAVVMAFFPAIKATPRIVLKRRH